MTEAAAIIATDRPASDSAKMLNRYLHRCEAVGKVEYYSACLMIIEHTQRGENFFFDRCPSKINEGACPALKMREEELAADKALYYRDLVDPTMRQGNFKLESDNFRSGGRVDYQSLSYKRGRYGADAPIQRSLERPIVKPAPKPEPVKPSGPADFGKAVADMINSEVAKPPVESKPIPKPRIERLPGESPLAFAQRRKRLEG